MALPNSVNSATPAGGDNPSLGDDQFRDLKTFLEDIFSIPDNTSIAAAGLDFVAGGLQTVIFQDAAANPGTAGYLQRNGVNVVWHNGTAAGRVFYAGGTDVPVADGGTALSEGTSGGVLAFTGTTTLASSAALTANGVVLGGGAGAVPTSLGAMTNGQLVIGSTGATPVVAALTAGSNITLTPAAGGLTIAATNTYSQSAAVTTSQTTTSTTFTDLATGGPAITMSPGATQTHVIGISAFAVNSGASVSYIGVTVGGAAVADGEVAAISGTNQATISRTIRAPSQSNGAIHTMKYRVSGGTGTFEVRWITGWVA